MIGKVVQGQSFFKVLNYLHRKAGAQKIGGTMAGQVPRELAAEFQASRSLNLRLAKVVCHTSLSLPKTERLPDQQWRAIAKDYLQAMGYGDCQYVVYRHHDQEHDHIHIVVSRIRLADGKTVKDAWEKRRAEGVLRTLEQAYELVAVPLSQNKMQKAPKVGEMRKFERTGEVPIRLRLQQAIDAVVLPRLSIAQFTEALQHQGIQVRWCRAAAGQITGISYSLDGIAFSGGQLGKAYTFPGLKKYQGLVDEPMPAESFEGARGPEPLAVISPQDVPKPAIAPTPLPSTQNTVSPVPDYPRLWQYYAQGLQATNPVTLNAWVARRALTEGRSPQEVAQMLLQSPFVREMMEKQREPEKIRAYINQTVHQAYQQQRQSSNQSNQVRRQKQRSGDLEL
jgi:hypothetical protein